MYCPGSGSYSGFLTTCKYSLMIAAFGFLRIGESLVSYYPGAGPSFGLNLYLSPKSTFPRFDPNGWTTSYYPGSGKFSLGLDPLYVFSLMVAVRTLAETRVLFASY